MKFLFSCYFTYSKIFLVCSSSLWSNLWTFHSCLWQSLQIRHLNTLYLTATPCISTCRSTWPPCTRCTSWGCWGPLPPCHRPSTASPCGPPGPPAPPPGCSSASPDNISIKLFVSSGKCFRNMMRIDFVCLMSHKSLKLPPLADPLLQESSWLID